MQLYPGFKLILHKGRIDLMKCFKYLTAIYSETAFPAFW